MTLDRNTSGGRVHFITDQLFKQDQPRESDCRIIGALFRPKVKGRDLFLSSCFAYLGYRPLVTFYRRRDFSFIFMGKSI